MITSANKSADSLVQVAGFKTTVFPMANAGATYLGKLIRKRCMDIKYVIAKCITPERK